MRQNYSKPCITKINQLNQTIAFTQYVLTAFASCQAETPISCQNDLTPTVDLLFCSVGIKDGSLLEGCSLSLFSCPAEMTNCHTEPSLQGSCPDGLAVECSLTFDCTASCGGSPTFEVSCGGSEFPCPGLEQ